MVKNTVRKGESTMNYRFAVENRNYEDYSSGRVFYNQKGTTSFPVRLASEIYQHCKSILINHGCDKPYVLYDPCCGGAYLLASIGFLHGEEIEGIYASDVDDTAIQLAQRNLALLTKDGMDNRIREIQKMIEEFSKDSHCQALESALNLKNILGNWGKSKEVQCFVSDITKNSDFSNTIRDVNMIITDLPYGEIVSWNSTEDEQGAVEKLLENVLQVMSKNSVIAIISKSKSKIKHKDFMQMKRFIIGKRQVTILKPINTAQ
jgi:23S rRNA (guanine2535-N1)-methyltransferase